MPSQKRLWFAAACVAALGMPAQAGQAASNDRNQHTPGVFRTAPPGVAHVSYTAVVAANGKLVRGLGAVHASRAEGKGTSIVDFATDVTSCVYVVTVGSTSASGVEPAAAATVVGASGDPSGVYVETFGTNGNLQNFPYHIDVGC